jgi:hypothetical protein
MNRINLVDGFFKEEASILYTIARNFDGWENRGHHFWDGRVSDVFKVVPECLGMYIVEKIRNEILGRFPDIFPEGDAYFDTIDLVRWPVGSSQPPHQDDIPHKHRLVGSIVYINDDYVGGETYYPNLDVKVTPIAGNLALHLGDKLHLHGVTEVSGKARFTISSFWGNDPSKASFNKG